MYGLLELDLHVAIVQQDIKATESIAQRLMDVPTNLVSWEFSASIRLLPEVILFAVLVLWDTLETE